MTPQIKTVVTRYSFGILFQITAIFILLAIGMTLIGVEGAIVLALCAAVFNLIPYVGPIIGAALGILLGLGQLYAAGVADPNSSVNLVQSLYLLIGLFGLVQVLDNVLFQPLIFSNSVGAHPLEIFWSSPLPAHFGHWRYDHRSTRVQHRKDCLQYRYQNYRWLVLTIHFQG